MTEATWYSVGVDLSQIPWHIATVDASGVESVADGNAHRPTSSERSSESGEIEGIVAAVRQVAAERGAMPASIALYAAPGRDTDTLTGEVARRLGMEASAVQLLPAAHTGTMQPTGVLATGALALGAARSAAAIGRVSTTGPAAVAGPTGVSLSPGGVGPAGVSLGSGAAGPAGVSLSAGGAVASAGVPLGASSVSGPIGVPLGAGLGVGPTGQPLTGTGAGGGGGGGLAGKLLRLPVVVGAAVALIVVTAVVVVASRDDAPSVALVPRNGPLATGPGVVGETVPGSVAVSTTLGATTLTPTSLAAVTAASSAAGCVVGSWVADNQAYLDAMTAASANIDIRWETATGVLRLDIASNGVVVTTYEDWRLTSTLGGAGTGLTSVVGVDTNTVNFGDDGTYSVSATEIGSQMQVSSGGFVIRDGLSQDSLFRGASTYACTGDRLEILYHSASDFGETDLVLVFVRSG